MRSFQVTYIEHSGFLVETETCSFLFDYYQGAVPDLPIDKPLFVFVSHSHADHFHSAIFSLFKHYEQIHYVLSFDLHLNARKRARLSISDEQMSHITIVEANRSYSFSLEGETLLLQTLHSTDRGVAFLLDLSGTIFYHAGDLNWWYWKEESLSWNQNMTANFKREMEYLKGLSIDCAFLPLDPRQEEYYFLGMDYFLQITSTRYVFPMHMWEEYSIIPRFQSEHSEHIKKTVIMIITSKGQHFSLP